MQRTEDVIYYDADLAQRVREVLAELESPGLVEKTMFGGVAFMVRGNLACGVLKDGLIVRVAPERYQKAIGSSYARPFDLTGAPMPGWIMVTPEGYKADDTLAYWVRQGIKFAGSLPAQ